MCDREIMDKFEKLKIISFKHKTHGGLHTSTSKSPPHIINDIQITKKP